MCFAVAGIITRMEKEMFDKVFQFAKKTEEEKVRLICFHHAGGSASFFADWIQMLDPEIGLYPYQLPGHGARMKEDLCISLEEAAEDAAAELKHKNLLNKPILFLGHSMGGIIAYLTAYLLWSRDQIKIDQLFITASIPDLNKKAEGQDIQLSDLSDEDFCAALKMLGAVNERMLQVKEFYKYFLPVIRADIKMVEQYRPDEAKKITCGIQIFGGKEDKLVDANQLYTWKNFTSKEVFVKIMEGHHFFVNQHKQEVCDAINIYYRTEMKRQE